MKIVDLNILLYVVNRDAPHHAVVRRWWDLAVGGGEPLGLAWVVLLGFLRIATNPRIFAHPLDAATAISKLDSWLAVPSTRLVQENEDHWLVLRSLVEDVGAAGNLTTDAHLATLAISHGAVLVSCDSDFARFRTLRWENPLT